VTRGYWVAFADVSDPEGYKAYIAENAKAFFRSLAGLDKSENPAAPAMKREAGGLGTLKTAVLWR
jgi:hypothetical protein